VATASKHAPHRQSQPTRQVVSLVEAALEQADGMERHRDDRIRSGEQVRPCFGHQPGQLRCEAPTPLVLQRMHELAQGAFISARASRG
jgi:hypothetical protein